MGKLIVENATVERVFQTSNGSWGVRVAEPFTRQDGEIGNSYFTLWFVDQPNLMQGNVISAEGRVSAKVREFQRNGGPIERSADISMNDAQLLDTGAGNAVAAPTVAPTSQQWHLPPASEKGPF